MNRILDLTAGHKSMWFDTAPDLVTYCDLVPKSSEVIKINWAEKLPFEDSTFNLVVFDPPHLTKSYASTGIIAKRYGCLFDSWESDLQNAFEESHRILVPGGLVIFKWATRQLSIHRIFPLVTPKLRPLFGHTTVQTKRGSTLWFVFYK